MKHSKPNWLYAGILLLFLQPGMASTAASSISNRGFEIPFEYKNHFILVHLTFQNVFPLTFIFDTGAETTLLTSVEIAGLLGLTYEREIQIVGADLEKELRAFLVRDVHFQIASLSMPHQSILVLEEDLFHFNEYTGQQVHGILGASLFRQFIVEIDYESQIIRLIPPDNFRPYKNVEALPLEIHRSKPYLNTQLKPPNGPEIPVKLLIDTGAGLAMLIHPNTHPDLEIPQKVIPGNIGMGLGGNLEGVMGLIPMLKMGAYQLREIPAHFQEIRGTIDSVFLHERNGILGNKVLERYTVTLDYFRGKMYLQPNRLFKKDFPVDKSGLMVIASGPDLKTYMVHAVLDGSPGQKAGIQPGDIIVSINYTSFRFFDLDAIYRIFSRHKGKKVRLKIDRKGEKFRTEFRLQDLL